MRWSREIAVAEQKNPQGQQGNTHGTFQAEDRNLKTTRVWNKKYGVGVFMGVSLRTSLFCCFFLNFESGLLGETLRTPWWLWRRQAAFSHLNDSNVSFEDQVTLETAWHVHNSGWYLGCVEPKSSTIICVIAQRHMCTYIYIYIRIIIYIYIWLCTYISYYIILYHIISYYIILYHIISYYIHIIYICHIWHHIYIYIYYIYNYIYTLYRYR